MDRLLNGVRVQVGGKAFAARFVDSPVAGLKAEALKLTGASPPASSSAPVAVLPAGSGSARAAGSASSP